MAKPVTQSDIVPGIVAAGAFLGLVFGVHTPFPLGLVAAVGVYFGVRLLMPQPPVQKEPDISDTIRMLRNLADLLGTDPQSIAIRDKIRKLCDIGDQLLYALPMPSGLIS